VGRFPDQGWENVVAIPAVGGRGLTGECRVFRRPYEKSKRRFSGCSHGGTPSRTQQEGGCQPLPGRVWRFGGSGLGWLGGRYLGDNTCRSQSFTHKIYPRCWLSIGVLCTRSSLKRSPPEITMKAHLKGFSRFNPSARDPFNPLVDLDSSWNHQGCRRPKQRRGIQRGDEGSSVGDGKKDGKGTAFPNTRFPITNPGRGVQYLVRRRDNVSDVKVGRSVVRRKCSEVCFADARSVAPLRDCRTKSLQDAGHAA